jgi:hypothetical protein
MTERERWMDAVDTLGPDDRAAVLEFISAQSMRLSKLHGENVALRSTVEALRPAPRIATPPFLLPPSGIVKP